MNALDVVEKLSTTNVVDADLRFCLVNSQKVPYRIDGTRAKPNCIEDFVSFEDLLNSDLNSYAGIGISIQGSNICAIDVDHCFSEPNNLSSGDDRAKDILDLFRNEYCEYSFSGTGLRILFRQPLIEKYSDTYYIKNNKNGIEFYQPAESFRYVTLTGNFIYDNPIEKKENVITNVFLNRYMLRPLIPVKNKLPTETKSFDQLQLLLKRLIYQNSKFQDIWFSKAPGSGKDESERDYFLILTIYEKVTSDKALIKTFFEQSPFFKSKDYHHVYKWNAQNYRYYNYIYDVIRRTKNE